MFYVVKKSYVGFDFKQDRYVDTDTIEIRTRPVRDFFNGGACVKGWCGSYGDMAIEAYGEYETVKEAYAAITRIFGGARGIDVHTDDFKPYDDCVVAIYKPGKYTPLSAEASVNLVWSGIEEDVRADSTDEELEALFVEYEKKSNECGTTLDEDAVLEAMEEQRKALQERNEWFE